MAAIDATVTVKLTDRQRDLLVATLAYGIAQREKNGGMQSTIVKLSEILDALTDAEAVAE